MNDSRSINSILIVVLAMFLAAWLGYSVVTNQSETLLRFAGFTVLGVCILLGRRIWLLMMFFAAANVPLIRGFGTAELGFALFIGFSTLLFLIRRLPAKYSLGEPEFWGIILALVVAQAYLRNPVGLGIFNAGAVGARPYFLVALSLATAFILSILVVPPNELRWAARLTIVGGFLGIPLGAMRVRAGYESMRLEQEGARLPWLNATSEKLIRWVVAVLSPYQAILKPLALIAIMFCIVAAAGSGYRNAVAMVGLYLFAGVFYHHGFFAMIASTLAAAMCIAALAAVNVVAPLPQQMQRALTPFPGTWDERYVRDAEGSTEWRIEMWKEALFTDFWIKNKILGDGLGMTQEELKRALDLTAAGQEAWRGNTGLTNQQEAMMASGSYHSGPVQTVRTVGYVGLAVLLMAMIRLAVYAHRQIRRCQNTEWAFLARFFGIPLIILPIFFTLVFGDFGKDLSVVLLGFGFMRLFERNVPVPVLVRNARHREFLRHPTGPGGTRPAGAEPSRVRS